MYDLYGKKAGDKLSIGVGDSYLYSELYAECLAYDMVPYVEYAMLTQSYFATLVDINTAPLSKVAETIALAALNQLEPVRFTNPGKLNVDSLSHAIKRRMEAFNHRMQIIDEGHTLVVSKVDGWCDLATQIKAIAADEGVTVIPTCGFDAEQVRALIYRVGKKQGYTVAAYAGDNCFRVVFSEGKIARKTRTVKKHSESPTANFRNTVNLMAWDTPYPFSDTKPERLRVLASQHPLPCLTVSGITLTKRSLMVGKHEGKIAVLFKGEPVLKFDVTSKKDLTPHQQAQIEDTLAAYKDKV